MFLKLGIVEEVETCPLLGTVICKVSQRLQPQDRRMIDLPIRRSTPSSESKTTCGLVNACLCLI